MMSGLCLVVLQVLPGLDLQATDLFEDNEQTAMNEVIQNVTQSTMANDAQCVPLVEHPIIFFDGVCGMCNAFVNVVMRLDRRGVFRFAPLQGETARQMLPPLAEDPRHWSTTLLDEDGAHDESDGPLLIFRKLGGIWRVIGWFVFVPKFVRDPVYRFIARRRYSFLGKKEVCRMPTAQERERFLD